MTASAAARPPGLRFEWAQAARPVAERPASGVPLFVGFGKPRREFARHAPAVPDVDSWEHFRACVEVRDGSFLDEAVKGFFANGGELCSIYPVDGSDGAALIQPFERFGALEDITGIDLVCVPDAVSAPAVASLAPLQAAALAHCAAMGDRFALLDAAPSRDGVHADALREQAGWQRSSLGALYFPWLEVEQRAAQARAPLAVPPSGHVAGVVARTDARAGVYKAPANEPVEGALAAQWSVDDALHEALNEAGLNCIRDARGSGLRVWGARTLSGHGDWRYVPVARTFLALTRWLKQNMDDVVFESNTPDLWRRVERRIAGYCMDLLDSGALAGSEPSNAFVVKCDAELNPPDSRDAGRLVAEVGLATSVPAEFVVVRIVHDASGIVLIET